MKFIFLLNSIELIKIANLPVIQGLLGIFYRATDCPSVWRCHIPSNQEDRRFGSGCSPAERCSPASLIPWGRRSCPPRLSLCPLRRLGRTRKACGFPWSATFSCMFRSLNPELKNAINVIGKMQKRAELSVLLDTKGRFLLNQKCLFSQSFSQCRAHWRDDESK